MVALLELPPELLADIVAETARIWPHLLWKQPTNEFRRLEDDWRDLNAAPQLHHYADCPKVYKNGDGACSLCTDSKLGFILLTHVCSLMREITISMPVLWTTVSDMAYPYSDVGWIETFLARSQDLPLNYSHRVDWGLSNESRSLSLRNAYLQALPRIRTLYLVVRGGLRLLDVFSEFMSDAISLEILVLVRLPAFPLRLPNHFPCPRLRELAFPTFDPTGMPWQHDALRNLTGLRLSFAHMRPVSFASLLNGLRVLGGTETLSLLKIPVLFSEESAQDLDIENVRFSHLTALSLHGRARGVMELLNRITAPNVREVDLVCYKFIAEFRAALVRLPRWVPGLAFSDSPSDDFVTASIIHDESNSTLTLGLSRMTATIVPGPFHFRLIADWEQRWATEGEEDQENLSPTDVLEIIMPTIVDPWAASRVKHLTISLNACSSRSLRRCISPFTSVSTLSVHGFMTISCVVELMAQSGTDAAASMLFPKLTMLHARTMQEDDHTFLGGLIATMLQFRAQTGHAIQWRTFSS